MPSPPASQAAILRALAAAHDAGLHIASFAVSRDGTLTVDTTSAKPLDQPDTNVQPSTPKKWAKR